MVTLAAALIVIPLLSSLIELLLLSSIVTVPGPSLSVNLLTAGRFNNELLLPVLVVERDLHAVARAEDFLKILARAIHRLRRRIAPVPQAADDIRSPRIAALEDNEHFVVLSGTNNCRDCSRP